jgi:hypothetical protein
LKDLEINQEPAIASDDIKMTTAGEREVCFYPFHPKLHIFFYELGEGVIKRWGL